MKILSKIAKKGKLSFGIVFPIESYEGSVPKMKNQEHLAQVAESVGFKSLWFRDVPLHDPTFGDSGQMYDPFVYMAHMMNQTKDIMLSTGSIILPLRHPIHTRKSINSLQALSDGRIIVGIASGDRPIEFPAYNQDINKKAELFRESFHYLKALGGDFPIHESPSFGTVHGNVDLLPKSMDTPYLVTGHSGQSLDWIAANADGWLYYPRGLHFAKIILEDWNIALQGAGYDWKPFMQSLYIDLVIDKKIKPTGIHLGFRCNVDYLIDFLKTIESLGVNHVVFNLKFNQLPMEQTLQILGEQVFKEFSLN